jgi:DNA polymerase-3 subunit delta
MMSAKVHLIVGNDEYRVSGKARQVLDALVPADEQALAVEIVDASVETGDAAVAVVSQALEAVLTAGFFGGRKVVWLKDVSFLRDSPLSRQADVKAAVERLGSRIRAGLPSGHHLVITAPAVDGRTSFCKTCKEQGEAVEFKLSENNQSGRRELDAWLADVCGQRGLRMSPAVQGVFVERVGRDTRQLATELDKLALYLGRRNDVRAGDIEAISSSSSESLVWDLADAAGDRDLNRALIVFRRLLLQRESPIGLVIGLQRRMSELILYREAIDRGWLKAGKDGRRSSGGGWGRVPAAAERLLAEDMEKDPRQTHPYRSAILAGQAQRFSSNELQKCRRLTVAAQEALVSGTCDESIVLESLLVKMLAVTRVSVPSVS